MTITSYPSPNVAHRRADFVVHLASTVLILVGGGLLLRQAHAQLDGRLIGAVAVYVACALASNLASWTYHFAPLHAHRQRLRRVDHAAIYLSITGTFTPFFVQASTGWTLSVLWICWGLTAVAIVKKVTDENVKSKWSTASYLGLGAVGLSALPELSDVPTPTLWCILAGAVCYVLGTTFYVRKTMPYRYAVWHIWVTLGAMFMFAGIWIALF